MGLFSFLERKVSMSELETIYAKTGTQIHFKELALHIAISYIANTLSKCEFKVYKGGKEVKDEMYYALNVDPNPNMNASQFINAAVNSYFRKGGALIVPIYTRNHTRLYCADGFQVEKTPMHDDMFRNITIETEQYRKDLKASDVFYLRLDDLPVKNLIDSVYLEYGTIMQMTLDSYRRSMGRKYKLVLEQYKAGDADFNKVYNEVLKKQLESFMKHDNAVYPQFKGTDLQDVSKGATGYAAGRSVDIINIRKEVFDVVAQAFKIPLPMMYGNITSMAEIVNIFLTFCIDPLADMFSEEITRKTNTFGTWSKGDRVVLDTTAIRHMDILEVAQYIEKLVSSGVMMVDEVRERISLNPYGDAFGQTRFVTKNFQTDEEALTGEYDKKGGEDVG